MNLTKINPSDITFEKKLSSSLFSVIFLVTVRELTCVMKVHHGRGPKTYYEKKDRETNCFISESRAYARLKELGICDRGVVPDFFGTLEKLNPSLYQPHLINFLNDEYPANAILIEYIPNLKRFNWDLYTPQRGRNFMEGIKVIHHALIEHSDIHPRNMMVIEGDPERAIWIDFDRAQTFDTLSLNDEQKYWLESEIPLVKECVDFMATDFQEGQMRLTRRYSW